MSAFILAGLPLAATAHAQPSPAPASGVDLGALNRSADACGDFYELACGGWLAKNPLPADRRNWGRFAEVQERNFATLRRILDSPSGDADERKAGDYYASCMDEAAIDAAGVRPLAPTLERIGALQDRADLPALLARLHGVAMLPSGPGRAPYSTLFDLDFFARTLRGQQEPTPRVRLCIADTDERLGEALGKAYVQEAFGPQAKADMLKMVAGIKAAMRGDIRRADWMTEPTKNAATRKLDAVADRIGYPDLWRSYAAVRIDRSDALGNFQRALAFERQRDLMKIGRPIDRSEWHMTPPTVNAYYSPLENNINFPAGILQLPFYSAARDAAVNYGAIGAVIGHELTHGFDDQGRRFDTDGSLRDWWTADDADAFEDRADCIADQYSEYVVEGDTRVNGRLTLGENTADNGGLRLALMAYLAGPGATPQPMLDGFTPEQRVFLGWAQSWCEVSRPETERIKAATNPHASNRYRVVGPLSNMPEFQKAFSCKAGSPMVREQACRVW